MVEYVHPDFQRDHDAEPAERQVRQYRLHHCRRWQSAECRENHLLPDQKQAQAPYVDGAINSSPIIADTFFVLPNKPVVNTYAHEGTTNLNVELKTPVQPETPVSYTTWFGTVAETSQLRRSVNQFIDAVRSTPL